MFGWTFSPGTIVQLGVVAGEAVPRLPGREAVTRYCGQDARRLTGLSVPAFDRHLSTRAVGTPHVVHGGARFVDAYVARGRAFVVAHPATATPFDHHGRPTGPWTRDRPQHGHTISPGNLMVLNVPTRNHRHAVRLPEGDLFSDLLLPIRYLTFPGSWLD